MDRDAWRASMAEASIETRAMEASEKINARIKTFYEDNDDSLIMSCKDAIRDILTEYNLTYKLQMPPECVGVHSDNRAGQGLIPADVHPRAVGHAGCWRVVMERSAGSSRARARSTRE